MLLLDEVYLTPTYSVYETLAYVLCNVARRCTSRQKNINQLISSKAWYAAVMTTYINLKCSINSMLNIEDI